MPIRLNTTYVSPALGESLSRIPQHPVTLLTAPMGCGKTRAAAWWAERFARQCPQARILRQSLVTGSVQDAWRGFCRTLRPWPELCARMEQLGFPREEQSRGLFLELLCDGLEEGTGPVIYLLDDAHRLADPAFSALLLFLGLRLPERVRLVVLSRSPVFDARAKLALGDRLLEIGSADLRLTPEGAADYARRCGLRLTPGDAEALVRDTGGWFAMVYLWLEHYRQQGAWPAPGAGADALVDEALFAPLSPERQGFLVRLGLTEGLSAQGAAFLFPGLDAPALLEELAGQNAFLTCTGGVWRCHHLLRACARERFARFSPEEQRAVLDRLGQWYAQTGETRAAAQCFARAESWDALLDAVGADGGLSLGPEALPLAREWMEACPEEALLRHPQAILVFLLLLFYARDLPGMERYHALLDRSMAQCAGLSPVLRDQLEGEALLRLSFLAFNDISAMSAYHRRIRALLPLPRNPWTQGSPSVLLLYHSHPGALDRENGEMAECMPIYSRAAGGHGSGAAALMAGETALLRGDFAEAAILCRRAESQAREGAEPSIGAAAAFLAARLALYEDTPRDGGDFLRRTGDVLRRERQYRLLTTLELARAWQSALLGRAGELPPWLTGETDSIVRVFPLIAPLVRVFTQKALLARGEWTLAAAQTPELARGCRAARFAQGELYAHLQGAEALAMLGKTAEAKQALQDAWALAQPDGLILPFAESGECLAGLMDALLPSEDRARVRTLAGRFRRAKELLSRPDGDPFSVLTQRERDIALLAAQRRSSREIAQALCLTVKSVDNRLNTIYEKLGLGGRGRSKRQALAALAEGHLSEKTETLG